MRPLPSQTETFKSGNELSASSAIRNTLLHNNPYKTKSEREMLAYAEGILDAEYEYKKVSINV